MNKKNLVISGINLYEGGPLSVYKDILNNILEDGYDKRYRIIAFVHNKDLFKEYSDRIDILELPKSRKNYVFRLYYEYVYFYRFSKTMDIDTWISLHDITPNVKSKYLYTYCHNPSLFLKTELRKIKYSSKTVAFSLFYKYLYRINIKKNDYVIVQQNWIREEFLRSFPISNIIVARPSIKIENILHDTLKNFDLFTFIFPSYPRYFKNIEVICEACEHLERKGVTDFQVLLTIDGSENSYSRMLVQKYCNLKTIKWIGLQERKEIFSLYNISDCLLFPSKLETWGLPISEFKQTKKTILVSDLPYAYETIGTYEKVAFFDPNASKDLAHLMECELTGENVYSPQIEKLVGWPYAENWKSLLDIILR